MVVAHGSTKNACVLELQIDRFVALEDRFGGLGDTGLGAQVVW